MPSFLFQCINIERLLLIYTLKHIFTRSTLHTSDFVSLLRVSLLSTVHNQALSDPKKQHSEHGAIIQLHVRTEKAQLDAHQRSIHPLQERKPTRYSQPPAAADTWIVAGVLQHHSGSPAIPLTPSSTQVSLAAVSESPAPGGAALHPALLAFACKQSPAQGLLTVVYSSGTVECSLLPPHLLLVSVTAALPTCQQPIFALILPQHIC